MFLLLDFCSFYCEGKADAYFRTQWREGEWKGELEKWSKILSLNRLPLSPLSPGLFFLFCFHISCDLSLLPMHDNDKRQSRVTSTSHGILIQTTAVQNKIAPQKNLICMWFRTTWWSGLNGMWKDQTDGWFSAVLNWSGTLWPVNVVSGKILQLPS